MKETTTTVHLDELSTFVREFLTTLVSTDVATVLALSGDLGAGKTTFVKALAKELGVQEEVTSPTFTIMKGYEIADSDWSTLLHMDAYRIEEQDELRPLRFEELLKQPQTLFCVEWAEKIKTALPDTVVWLHFENTKKEHQRTVRISKAPVNG